MSPQPRPPGPRVSGPRIPPAATWGRGRTGPAANGGRRGPGTPSDLRRAGQAAPHLLPAPAPPGARLAPHPPPEGPPGCSPHLHAARESPRGRRRKGEPHLSAMGRTGPQKPLGGETPWGQGPCKATACRPPPTPHPLSGGGLGSAQRPRALLLLTWTLLESETWTLRDIRGRHHTGTSTRLVRTRGGGSGGLGSGRGGHGRLLGPVPWAALQEGGSPSQPLLGVSGLKLHWYTTQRTKAAGHSQIQASLCGLQHGSRQEPHS